MKVLEMVNSIFPNAVIKGSIKGVFMNERKIMEDDERFFNMIIQYLGGRGYNNFLDYSLLTIKMRHILDPVWWNVEKDGENVCRALVMLILLDDRHDLWQNMPYYMDDICKAAGPEMATLLRSQTLDAVIDCISVDGVGDVSMNFTVEE